VFRESPSIPWGIKPGAVKDGGGTRQRPQSSTIAFESITLIGDEGAQRLPRVRGRLKGFDIVEVFCSMAEKA